MENTLLSCTPIPLCSHPSVPFSKLGFVMYEVQSVCALIVMAHTNAANTVMILLVLLIIVIILVSVCKDTDFF